MKLILLFGASCALWLSAAAASAGMLSAVAKPAKKKTPAKPTVLSTRYFKLTLPPGWTLAPAQKATRGQRFVAASANKHARARITIVEKPKAFGDEIHRTMTRLSRRIPDFRLILQREARGRTGDRRFVAMGVRSFKREKHKKHTTRALLGVALLDLPKQKALVRLQLSLAAGKGHEAEKRFAAFMDGLELAGSK